MDTGETIRTAPRRRSIWQEVWGRLIRKKVAVAAMTIITVLYGAGILAPWVAPYDYNQQDLTVALQGPSPEHPLGTDRLGRDLLSRIIWGLRTTVIVTIAAIFTGSLFLGILLGTLAGYLGKRADMAIMRVGDIFLAFPGMLLIILIAATLKPRVVDWVRYIEDTTALEGLVQSGMVDYFVVFGALALFGWVGMARLVRGQMLYLKE
ncbi:MAG: ABC transporter permease, partial [Chloroflexota bacterium]|nr:ABC transporter permease [Chloroflexota bacterium]